MNALEKLKGGLVVSCQPVSGGAMDHPEIIAAMAQAAVAGGAAGLRIEGVENLRAVRQQVSVPIIALVKRDDPTTLVRITPSINDARDLIDAGADIVAYDATDRPRQDQRDTILHAILEDGGIAMADCSTTDDALSAISGGVSIIGTTLSGYAAQPAPEDGSPDIELVKKFKDLDAFTMAEGRYNTPELAAAAMNSGADAVTVGSALTRLEHVTEWFANALGKAGNG